MEPACDGWRNELRKYWCKIEQQTRSSLQLIKTDLIQSGLVFDDKFKDNFLRSTYNKYEILKFIYTVLILSDLYSTFYVTPNKYPQYFVL